jgi:hydrogenase expression/formation protein HypC
MCLGIPGRITAIKDACTNLAIADFNGVQRVVNITCVREDHEKAEDLIGAWVLVHVGFAMSRIDEAEAAETLRILTELGEAQNEIAAMGASGRA